MSAKETNREFVDQRIARANPLTVLQGEILFGIVDDKPFLIFKDILNKRVSIDIDQKEYDELMKLF